VAWGKKKEKRTWGAREEEIFKRSALELYVGSNAGVSVTPDNAMRLSAVYACIRVIAESVATLPLKVYRLGDDGLRQEARDHPYWRLLHESPNEFLTSNQFIEIMQANLCLHGNAYAEIETDNTGNVVAFWPIPATRCNTIDRQWYSLNVGNETKVLPYYRVLHIPALSFDGIKGRSPLRDCAETIGLGLAAEQYGAQFFGSNAIPPLVLKHPGILSDEARENLGKQWQNAYAGLTKSQRVAVLEEGLEIERLSVPPEDSQFLETRKFEVEEIARIFRVPLHKIQHQEKSTSWGSGIEQLNTAFVTDTLRPWLVRWEQILNRKLFDGTPYFAEFELQGLLRGDSEARSKYYKEMLWLGAMSPNEIRRLENMAPIDGGDKYYIPLNLVSTSSDITSESPAQLEGMREMRTVNKRSRRQGAMLRKRVRESYVEPMRATWTEIFRGEKRNVLSSYKKLGDNKQAFAQWLDDFYRNKHQEFISKKITPIYTSLAQAIIPLASEEVNAKLEDEQAIFANVAEHVSATAYRQAIMSKKAIEAILSGLRHERQGLDGYDEEEELEEMLDGFVTERPVRVSADEPVSVEGMVAKTIFVASGIIYLSWAAMGDKPCPYCEELDGTIVGTEDPWVSYGQGVEAGGETMTPDHNITYPPLHPGCACSILPA